MKRTEYTAYVAAVNKFLASNNVKPGCHSPVDAENSVSFFSWRPCECCGAQLGGNRETYLFAINGQPGAFTEKFNADICDNCVYFLAYGKLDDATMAELE